MSDVIVTGLPRSGLTVAAALIDGLPDSLCLNEPGWQMKKAHDFTDPTSYANWLKDDFAARRAEILALTPIKDLRAPDGRPLLDGLLDERRLLNQKGKPVSLLYTKEGLSPDFTLAMKHHTLYTAMLPQIVALKHFKVIAIIRHPLEVILSWQRLGGNRPYMQGFIPNLFNSYWPQAAQISYGITDPLERMVFLYDAFCQRYHELGDQVQIVKYEDMVKKPLLVSSAVGAKKTSLHAPLIAEQQHPRLLAKVEQIRAALTRSSVFAKHFYSI